MSAGAAMPMRIDFISDVVCPWCAIGLAALEQALERIGEDVQAEIHFQPFELNPQLGPAGEPTREHLKNKYGLTDAQVVENQERIRERGAELGFTFAEGGRSRIVNTFDAHRLLHWAGIQGRQSELKHELLRACFTEDRDVSDHETLASVAGSAGLPEERAREVLASDAYAAEVRETEQRFLRAGINAVPAVIINQQHLISGGQPVEVFEHALREIAAGRA
ncbi:MAG: DsbA family oxidoreductase [Lysobacter sp.]|nr:DsbA family oxidoreductase [Lysobacter sp.]MDQ3269477.1 DsbA family oxidoreductase [Pseudomonadota bacterium]